MQERLRDLTICANFSNSRRNKDHQQGKLRGKSMLIRRVPSRSEHAMVSRSIAIIVRLAELRAKRTICKDALNNSENSNTILESTACHHLAAIQS